MTLTRDRLVALGCAVLSPAAAVAAIFATQDGTLHPSALVKISSQDPMAPYARASDPHFHFVSAVQHYDGDYYYAIARDPFMHGKAHTLIDQAAYRYGHPLHGWVAGLLSFGNARAVPLALLLVSLIGMAVGGWAISRLAVHFGRTPWAGLLLAASPGVLFSTTVDTTEAFGAALLALTMLAWVRQRYALAAALIVLVCLDKEQYVAIPVGLALWEIVEAIRHRSWPDRVALKATAVMVGPIVLTGWYIYVRGQLGTWPFDYQPGNLGKPVSGWIETFRLAGNLAGSSFYAAQIGNTTPVELIAIAVLLLIGVVAAMRVKTVFDLPFLGLALITSMQGWRTLLYPHEVFRTTAIAVLFAIAVMFSRGGLNSTKPSPMATDEPPGAQITSGACPDSP